MTADLLRRAADLIEQAATEATEKDHHYAGVRLIGEEWAALLSLPVAAPLAAWLRAAADAAGSYRTDNVMGRVMRAEGQAPAYRHTAEFIDGAVAFATAILGEQP